MRGTVAKRLRKRVWGADGSPRARQHFVGNPIKVKGKKTINGGFCIADQKRRLYQTLKRVHREILAVIIRPRTEPELTP